MAGTTPKETTKRVKTIRSQDQQFCANVLHGESVLLLFSLTCSTTGYWMVRQPEQRRLGLGSSKKAVSCACFQLRACGHVLSYPDTLPDLALP